MKSKLPEGWKEVKLGEVIKNHNKERIPLSKKEREKIQGVYPYYGAQGVIDYINNYIFDGKFLLVAEDGENLKSRKQNIAIIAEGKFWVNNHAHILTTNALADLTFVYYRINSLDIEAYLTGSVQPKLNMRNLYTVTFAIPPLPEQKAIAATLSALDDKIENNNKINENLEAQAQALFKHWFVDFEFPDENGNPYRSSGGVMVESEIGLIPNGWSVVKLGDISIRENKNVRFPQKGLINHFSIPAYDNYKDAVLEDGLTIKSNKYQINNDHVLLSRLNPRIKRLWRPICDGGNCVCSTEFMVLRSESEENKSLLYSILDSELFYEFMLTNVTGATNSHQRVSPPGIVLEYKLALPNHVLRNRFVKIVDTFHYKIDQNIKQNQTLAQIRDTLLPKLMSGEIRIPLD